jgi:predicted DNA-binding transcriptional regulator AlpA
MPTRAPEVVGATEGARTLGVSRQRFYELQGQRKDFPKPVARLSRGSLWDRAELEKWGRTRQLPAGRPRTRKDAPGR